MKHKSTFVASCFLLFAVLGCGLIGSSDENSASKNQAVVRGNANSAAAANQDLIDQAAALIFGEEKTGVPQCDEVLAKLETEMAGGAGEETLQQRAQREAVKQVIYKLVRDNATANTSEAEKTQIGERCRQAAAQFLTN